MELKDWLNSINFNKENLIEEDPSTIKDYISEPRRDWDDKKWLKHAHVMVHSPWISDADREYWRDKIKELTR